MKIPKGPVILWAVCVAAFVVSVLWQAQGLPPRVASHFGSSGLANGWTSRSTYTVFFILFWDLTPHRTCSVSPS